MVKVEFYLDDDDLDRLFFIKDQQGEKDLTANEFAKELLISELYHLHPKRVEYDDNGNAIQ